MRNGINININIEYNGAYPNLCRGKLIVTIDEKKWEFPPYCLSSGGRVWFDTQWNEHVEEGDWDVRTWPDDFPEEMKDEVLHEINMRISHGCCGGCV